MAVLSIGGIQIVEEGRHLPPELEQGGTPFDVPRAEPAHHCEKLAIAIYGFDSQRQRVFIVVTLPNLHPKLDPGWCQEARLNMPNRPEDPRAGIKVTLHKVS